MKLKKCTAAIASFLCLSLSAHSFSICSNLLISRSSTVKVNNQQKNESTKKEYNTITNSIVAKIKELNLHGILTVQDIISNKEKAALNAAKIVKNLEELLAISYKENKGNKSKEANLEKYRDLTIAAIVRENPEYLIAAIYMQRHDLVVQILLFTQGIFKISVLETINLDGFGIDILNPHIAGEIKQFEFLVGEFDGAIHLSTFVSIVASGIRINARKDLGDDYYMKAKHEDLVKLDDNLKSYAKIFSEAVTPDYGKNMLKIANPNKIPFSHRLMIAAFIFQNKDFVQALAQTVSFEPMTKSKHFNLLDFALENLESRSVEVANLAKSANKEESAPNLLLMEFSYSAKETLDFIQGLSERSLKLFSAAAAAQKSSQATATIESPAEIRINNMVFKLKRLESKVPGIKQEYQATVEPTINKILDFFK